MACLREPCSAPIPASPNRINPALRASPRPTPPVSRRVSIPIDQFGIRRIDQYGTCTPIPTHSHNHAVLRHAPVKCGDLNHGLSFAHADSHIPSSEGRLRLAEGIDEDRKNRQCDTGRHDRTPPKRTLEPIQRIGPVELRLPILQDERSKETARTFRHSRCVIAHAEGIQTLREMRAPSQPLISIAQPAMARCA
jgi:hypothetical protein